MTQLHQNLLNINEGSSNLFTPESEQAKPAQTHANHTHSSTNVFTKLSWVSPTNKAYDELIAILKDSIEKGHGETILELGVGG
jgi:hypothetical protein